MAANPQDPPDQPTDPADDSQGAGAPASTIHEAVLASGPTGAVEWGAEITEGQAVQRRLQGLDVVVRGPDGKANSRKAQGIEAMVGVPYTRDAPHPRAGPQALPHYHQVSRVPAGHTFYEIGKHRARKQRS